MTRVGGRLSVMIEMSSGYIFRVGLLQLEDGRLELAETTPAERDEVITKCWVL